jgi:transcriptional regulator with XRE-family HTH domain
MSVQIGLVLRQLRYRKRWSLRKVSERTGFSASFLSLVENGKASPSVASLEKIALAFGLTLAEFFQLGQKSPYQLVRAGERQSYTSEWSHIIVEVLAQQEMGGELYPLLLRLVPGARSGTTPQPSPAEEFTVVWAGSAVLWLGEEELLLNVGDSLSIAAGTMRKWENRGETEVVLLVVSKGALPVYFLDNSSAVGPEPVE